ncbi:MAG: hypothetical protein ABII06_10130 [Pseudomonadota bacterium]
MPHDFNFKATGIGSVPFLNIEGTCRKILSHVPEIPFWPQFVRRSLFEDMNVQYSEGLPLLKIDEKKRALVCENRDIESGLTEIYEKYLAEQVDAFSISEAYAPGFYRMLEFIGETPDAIGAYIKGQSVGPVTFASGIADPDGKSILYNPELLDAMVKGLSIKALWQVQALAGTGKKTILFLDEPVLSGFGSAFSAIQRDEVIRLIREVIHYLRERSDTLIGIHCCGNTDWSMIMEADPDIINFDAFGYMDYFLLYPKELTAFLNGGGIIAWGIVPTAGFSGNETVDELYGKMEEGLNRIYDWGVPEETLAAQSILTPACGMGSMEESSADHAFELLTRLRRKFSP